MAKCWAQAGSPVPALLPEPTEPKADNIYGRTRTEALRQAWPFTGHPRWMGGEVNDGPRPSGHGSPVFLLQHTWRHVACCRLVSSWSHNSAPCPTYLQQSGEALLGSPSELNSYSGGIPAIGSGAHVGPQVTPQALETAWKSLRRKMLRKWTQPGHQDVLRDPSPLFSPAGWNVNVTADCRQPPWAMRQNIAFWG